MKPVQAFDVYFSYSQLMVYDPAVGITAVGSWTEAHWFQGFVRGPGAVLFGTLLEFGTAHIEVLHGDDPPGGFQRAIRCPLRASSNTVWVVGPEEWPEPADHLVALPSQTRSISCAQSVIGDDELRVVLWFSTSPTNASEILVADAFLNFKLPLLEPGN